MDELRAPDPTLKDLGRHRMVQVDLYRTLPVAHGDSDGYLTPCGLSLKAEYDDYTGLADPELVFMGAKVARYLAVACQVCFPDAPPPGREFYNLMDQRNRVQVRTRPVKGLAWQVQP